MKQNRPNGVLKKEAMPLYSRISTIIENKIFSGQYEPGEKLPTEDELARIYGVSKITVRGALSCLETSGLINRIRGKGTFITQTVPEIKSNIHTSFNSIVKDHEGGKTQPIDIMVIKVLESRIPKDIRSFFGLSNDDDIGCIRSIKTAGRVHNVFESFIPAEFIHLITKKELGTGRFLQGILQEKADIEITKGTMILQAGVSDPDISDMLECQSFDPVIQIKAYYRCKPDRPMILDNVYFLARYFQYQIEMDVSLKHK